MRTKVRKNLKDGSWGDPKNCDNVQSAAKIFYKYKYCF